MRLIEQAKIKQTVSHPLLRASRSALVLAALLAPLSACAPVIDNRGYVFDERQISSLKKGITKRQTIQDSFGSPSTVTKLNGDAFYYVNSRFVTESYRAPEEVARKVLAIYFAADNTVKDFAVYGLDDGIIVPIIARTTATQGQELSVLGQIFGNLGRFGDNAPGSDF
jgi:outer membrane protein assembly factor BamE (lipoprotein component of BamABCDE complex)